MAEIPPIPGEAYEAAERVFRQMLRVGVGSAAYRRIVDAAAPALIQAGREAAAADIERAASVMPVESYIGREWLSTAAGYARGIARGDDQEEAKR